MQGSTKQIKDYKRRRKCNKQRKETNYKEKELRNKGRDSLNVSHWALDQSKRELVKKSSNLSSDLSKFSKVYRLRSFQIHHIKHNGAKF